MNELTPGDNRNKIPLEVVLKERGIEMAPDGRLVLYHATTADKLAKILKGNKIEPPKKTGESSWAVENEKSDEVKQSKVYLGSYDTITGISKMLTEEKGGRGFLVETKVPQSGLRADEDSGAGDHDWVESLYRLGTCSYEGEIDNIKVVKISDVEISRDTALSLMNSSLSDDELANEVGKIKSEIIEEENEIFRKHGIDPEKIIEQDS